MDKPISVGDLVQIIKPIHCCGRGKSIGKIFTVHHFEPFVGSCGDCGTMGDGRMLACPGQSWHGYSVERLKRIPPLEELEREKLLEKLPELVK